MSWFQGVMQVVEKVANRFDNNRNWNKEKDFTREGWDYQTQLSNTAYQRAAADLEAAGLNRVLALGNSASTPSTGSSASIKPLEKLNYMDFALKQQQISSAKQAEKLVREQTRSAAAQADKDEVTKKVYETAEPYLEKILNSADTWLKGTMSNSDANSMFGNSAKDTVDNWKKGVDEIENFIKGAIQNGIKKYESRRFGEKPRGKEWDGKIRRKQPVQD